MKTRDHLKYVNRLYSLTYRLRNKRMAKDMSVAELSKRSGITGQAIYKIEAGGNMTIMTLFKLCDALEIGTIEIEELR